MLDTHEKFRLIDKNKKNDLFVEVNWSDDAKINECKMVKFNMDGKEALVDVRELNSMLFAIGSPEVQRNLIPQTIKRSRHYETVISVKAKKDIKKGEEITFPIKITLPTVEDEVIAEVKRETTESKGGIILPK